MPTADQLDSRKTLSDFLASVAKPIKKYGDKIKSEWFGRPDEELKGWIERGNAIEEIKDTRGYRLIIAQTEKETAWAMAQLEVCEEKQLVEFRMYLRSLRFLKDYLLTTERNADISSSVLSGREKEIGKESFVRNARVEG